VKQVIQARKAILVYRELREYRVKLVYKVQLELREKLGSKE
jgi:hypothetical protein